MSQKNVHLERGKRVLLQQEKKNSPQKKRKKGELTGLKGKPERLRLRKRLISKASEKEKVSQPRKERWKCNNELRKKRSSREGELLK